MLRWMGKTIRKSKAQFGASRTRAKAQWANFRQRACRREERGHFGLAWSVFAGYSLAGAVFVRSFHENGWLLTMFGVIAVFFFVLGGTGVYMAFAVAMRWWPYQPKVIDWALFMKMQNQYNDGVESLLQWAKLSMEIKNPSPETTEPEILPAMAEERARHLMGWDSETRELIAELFGDIGALEFVVAPDINIAEPTWALESKYVGLWNRVQGGLGWMRLWMHDQLNL